MKALRSIIVTALLSIGAFFAITHTACNKDRCNNVACLNGGVCDGGSCTCAAGWQGNRCQTASRDKFIGTFNGGDSCGVGGYTQYSINFVKTVGNQTQMTMRNMLNDIDDSAICTLVGVDTFTFNGSNNSVTYRGAGKVSNDSLWMSYHVQFDTINYDCKYFGIGY